MGTRPAWPDAGLIDLAAGREPAGLKLTPELVAQAVDHRVGGLLWSWARANHGPSELRDALALLDLREQAHLQRLRHLLRHCVEVLAGEGIEVASIKGPLAEERWYRRAGERPSGDIDIWLSPRQLHRAGDALRALQPDHPWAPVFDELVAAGAVQTVTLKVGRIEVDLHLDLLKTGVPMKNAEEIWDAAGMHPLGDGLEVRTLDSESSLLHFLIHLNKDRFQRLLGYADIVRVIHGGVDWDRLAALAEGEGLRTAAACSLRAVADDLRAPSLQPPMSPGWIGGLAWRSIWPARIRLWGAEGRRRFRHRQLVIPALSPGRAGLVRAYLLQAVPPAAALSLRAERGGAPAGAARVFLSRALHGV